MPRETVRGADYHFEPAQLNPEFGVSAFPESSRLGCLEVGWNKYPTGNVEVASCDDAMLARLFAGVEKAHTEGDPVEYVRNFFMGGGLWVPMSRDGVNDCIRLLRKARDAAFRADA